MTSTLNTGNPYVLPSELPALREAIPILSRLVKVPDFLDSYVLPLFKEAGRAEDWYVAYRHDDPDCSTLCRSSSGLRVLLPRYTTIPPGEPSAASWDPSWKNATSVPTTVPRKTTRA